MSPEELLLYLEKYRSRRQTPDHRPEWLRRLIDELANLFEPICDVARAGYDCRLDENGWLVRLYLGTTEILGGAKDGQIEHASFRMDLQAVTSLFEQVSRLEWYSLVNTEPVEFDGDIRSLLSITGSVAEGGRVHVELLASPPRCVGPGLRQTASS